MHTHKEDWHTIQCKPAGLERVFIKVPSLTCNLHVHQHANHCMWRWGNLDMRSVRSEFH